MIKKKLRKAKILKEKYIIWLNVTCNDNMVVVCVNVWIQGFDDAKVE